MIQGRVRTKTIKKASKIMIEKYYTRLTLDFHTNKRICDEIATIPTKRLRNKVAGYVTHLMKRIQKGPVRGISIRLQEEERERRDNFVPEVSNLDNPDQLNIRILMYVNTSTYSSHLSHAIRFQPLISIP